MWRSRGRRPKQQAAAARAPVRACRPRGPPVRHRDPPPPRCPWPLPARGAAAATLAHNSGGGGAGGPAREGSADGRPTGRAPIGARPHCARGRPGGHAPRHAPQPPGGRREGWTSVLYHCPGVCGAGHGRLVRYLLDTALSRRPRPCRSATARSDSAREGKRRPPPAPLPPPPPFPPLPTFPRTHSLDIHPTTARRLQRGVRSVEENGAQSMIKARLDAGPWTLAGGI